MKTEDVIEQLLQKFKVNFIMKLSYNSLVYNLTVDTKIHSSDKDLWTCKPKLSCSVLKNSSYVSHTFF